MRVTKPRVALVEVLQKQEGPVSIERLHQAVGIKSCDLVTIYRCLAAFEGLGLVRRSYLHDGTCLYELTDGSARRYHIVCKACGKTDQVDYALSEETEQKLQDKGYSQISHVLEFFGVCPACQQVAKASTRGIAIEIPVDN
jgi:Fur family ferric uptake transcriptional regulator